MRLPPEFTATIERVLGDRGRAWLPRVPDLVARCRRRFGLLAGEPSPRMSLNYLELTTTTAGEPVALKVGVPHPELFSEMEALALFAGRGAVRLLDADRELGALLLPWVWPGTVLWEIGDNREQTRHAAAVMRALPVPVPPSHGLPTFERWLSRAFDLTRTTWDPAEQMPRALLDQAEAAWRELSGGEMVVLHGDLHHENILCDERSGWLAIDPKGVIGPRCLEVGRYLQNQLPLDSPLERARLVRERIEVFNRELGHPSSAVAAAGLVDLVLSHCWGFEEERLWPGWHRGLELARVFLEG